MSKSRLLGLSLTSILAVTAIVAATAWASGAPENTILPGVIGSFKVEGTLHSGPGTWTNSPEKYTYQWQRCSASGTECANISGATANQYIVAGADEGHTLRSQVTAYNTSGQGVAYSKVSTVIPTRPQFIPSNGHYPVKFEFSSPGSFETENGIDLPCTTVSGHGEITSPTTVSAVRLDLYGCESQGSGCQWIESSELKGSFGYINQATKEVGLVFEEGASPFATARCFGGPSKLRGAVIAKITPVNKLTRRFSFVYRGTGAFEHGTQEPNHFEGGSTKQLESTIIGGYWSRFGITAGGAETFSTNVEGEIKA